MRKNRVCPVVIAGFLDNKIRRWFQEPQKILLPFVNKGMTVLDIGCGPGFFSVDLARMVGKSGRVVASDMQEGMLLKLEKKIEGTEIKERIILHKCGADNLGIEENFDFILAVYMVHEVPDQAKFFREIKSILKTKGSVLVIEPAFHVSKKAFKRTIEIAKEAGLIACDGPKVFFSKTAVLKKDK